MHATTNILIFLCSALVVPGLNFLVVAVLILLLLLLSVPSRPVAPWRLLWRSRWLFLVILLGYAYSLPGPAALPALGDASPSLAGLQGGGLQAARLALLLLLLDGLVLRLEEGRLLSGLYLLFKGLAWTGLDPERLTVRLALTLRYMQDRAKSGVRQGLAAALKGEAGADGTSARMALPRQNWRARDSLVLVLGLGMVVLAWLRA